MSFEQQSSYIRNNYKLIFLYIIALVLAVIVGSRELSVGTDTLTYANRFFAMEEGEFFTFNREFGFQLFTYLAAQSGLGVKFYFTLISITLFILANKVVSEIDSINNDKKIDISLRYLVFSALLVSPFFVSSQINAIRQGMAGFLIFYVYLCFQNREWGKCIVISIIAISIHYASVMYILLLGAIFVPLPLLLGGVAFLSILYGIGGSAHLIAWISEVTNIELYSSITSYQQNYDYDSGVRYDFLLFSLFWVVFTMIFQSFWVKEQYQKTVELCLKIYVILLIPFLLLGFANFSNRYAYTAWLFAAILVAVTVRYSTLWDKLNKLLPYVVFSSVVAFIVMILNGFAR